MDYGTEVISPSGETPQDQATASPPGSQPQQPTPVRGPFTKYLDPSQTVQPSYTSTAGRPSGYMGAAGKIGYLADQLLAGIAKGRATAYNRSLAQTASTYKQLDTAAQDIKDSGLPEAEQTKLLNRLKAARMGFVAGAIDPDSVESVDGKKQSKTKKKDENKNPIVEFLHKSALALAGPGAQPQQITPKAVHEVLGEVYSTMLNTKSAMQAQSDVTSQFFQTYGKALEEHGSPKAAFANDPNVGKLYANLLAAYGNKVPTEITSRIKDMETQTALTDATIKTKNGIEHVKSDKFGNYYRDGKQIDSEEILDAGKQLDRVPKTPTAFEEKLTADKKYIAGLAKVSDPDKMPEELNHIAEVLADPGSGAQVRTQFEAAILRQGKNPNVQQAFRTAVMKVAAAADSTTENRLLSIVEKQNKINDKKASADKFTPREAKAKALLAVNGVHPATPEQKAAFEKQVSAIRNSADPEAAKQAAGSMIQYALDNVSDTNNFQDYSDEQRMQVIYALKALPVSEVIKGYHPYKEPSPTTAPTPGAQGHNGATGTSGGTGGPPPKVLGTESQLRAKAKAAGRSTADIDAMVKDARDKGLIK